LRVHFETVDVEYGLGRDTALLSYIDDFKTVKIHGLSYAKGKEHPCIDYVLKTEDPIECIEFLEDSTHNESRMPSALDVFNRCCPMLSKLVINLGQFHGYSPGWDREYREAIASRRMLPIRQIPISTFIGRVIISKLADFRNLRRLTVHFMLDYEQITLMHPSQGLQAAREIYQEIEKCKQGVRLEQLDVIFNTSSSNIYGCLYGYHTEGKVGVMMTCRCVESEERETKEALLLICNDRQCGKMIERRKKAEKIYGCRAWQHKLGPYTWKRLQGRKGRSKRFVVDLVTQVALLPAMFKTNEMKRAGKRGIFYA
jgi:hypothetical protein